MKLHFSCPHKKKMFSSDSFSLHQGYSIAGNGRGGKELKGTVSLNSACPLCGSLHQYDVSEVMCSLPGTENDEMLRER